MKDILVSVIVPIYNVERYVSNCVTSLLNQNYPNIEIILVDDGSPDGSGQIIDALAERDPRIHVIHKNNGGVSSARNAGLERAKGDFVMFVDGDDYVDDDYVSYFLGLVTKYNCDIGMNESNYNYKKTLNMEQADPIIISSEKAAEKIYLEKIFVAVWNKIYNRKILLDNNIRFDTDIWYGEGMLFNMQCLQCVSKVIVGNKSVYHQIYNPGSAMRNFNLESNYCGIRSLDKQRELAITKVLNVEKAWQYHRLCFSYTILCGLIKMNMVDIHMEEFKKCKKNLLFRFKTPMMVDIGVKKKIIHILIALMPVLMAIRSAKKDIKLSAKFAEKSE